MKYIDAGGEFHIILKQWVGTVKSKEKNSQWPN